MVVVPKIVRTTNAKQKILFVKNFQFWCLTPLPTEGRNIGGENEKAWIP